MITGAKFPTHAAEPGEQYQQESDVVTALWQMGADGQWQLVGKPTYLRSLRRSATRIDRDHDVAAECDADFAAQEVEEERQRRESYRRTHLGDANPPPSINCQPTVKAMRRGACCETHQAAPHGFAAAARIRMTSSSSARPRA